MTRQLPLPENNGFESDFLKGVTFKNDQINNKWSFYLNSHLFILQTTIHDVFIQPEWDDKNYNSFSRYFNPFPKEILSLDTATGNTENTLVNYNNIHSGFNSFVTGLIIFNAETNTDIVFEFVPQHSTYILFYTYLFEAISASDFKINSAKASTVKVKSFLPASFLS